MASELTCTASGTVWWINQRIEEIGYTNPGGIEKRTSIPEAIQGIVYIQKSLDDAFKTQKSFFENN